MNFSRSAAVGRSVLVLLLSFERRRNSDFILGCPLVNVLSIFSSQSKKVLFHLKVQLIGSPFIRSSESKLCLMIKAHGFYGCNNYS